MRPPSHRGAGCRRGPQATSAKMPRPQTPAPGHEAYRSHERPTDPHPQSTTVMTHDSWQPTASPPEHTSHESPAYPHSPPEHEGHESDPEVALLPPPARQQPGALVGGERRVQQSRRRGALQPHQVHGRACATRAAQQRRWRCRGGAEGRTAGGRAGGGSVLCQGGPPRQRVCRRALRLAGAPGHEHWLAAFVPLYKGQGRGS